MLKQDYKEGEMTLKTALALAIKVLNKTMDVSKLSAEKGKQFSDAGWLITYIYIYIIIILMYIYIKNVVNLYTSAVVY